MTKQKNNQDDEKYINLTLGLTQIKGNSFLVTKFG